ncbi:MAG: protein-glutamate O-methyltransferase CheR [Candidatus Magnetominusculus sp. LBB02]|nr:protein-glutamate O-methyltransferase CheR [Candidatus Magnetominusculus sp. LBB02]
MTVLREDTFRGFRDFIYEKSGIFIPENKKYFVENRLARRLQEMSLGSYDDYLNLLRFGGDKEEMRLFIALITTNETFFFREIQQMEVFINCEAPRLISMRGTEALKIWCSASATGEEPYTLAMMMMESPLTSGARAEIIASDISSIALEKARSASYGQYAVRNVPDIYLRKYFKLNGSSDYHLLPRARENVKFMQINLLDEKKMRTIRDMDAIFCRNVLIYFDKKAKIKVVESLYEALRPGGCLFIGMAESLHDITRLMRPTIINKTVVYRKQ